ncbi:AAA family ATPase [Aeromonas hydrophila]|uniref:AAA family ATPase n=1 Tax=Aeromonas hydrophila TaxID=644 RepID=UPI0020B2489B|nr:AAA family ATPase [Aeromonas hydrophila]MCP3323228.1 AAA family ATPase [Aeromonas hydrophila]
MITKIDIKNLGNYKNFNWDAHIRSENGNNVIPFKKLNIIYGRNYSGKTTISKIIRSLETGEIPKNYVPAAYKIYKDGLIYDELNLKGCDDVRVYNKDFVDENLSFLKDDNGGVASFAIIGDSNPSILHDIESKKITLGSIESKTGLAFDYHQAKERLNSATVQYDNHNNSIRQKLSKKATDQKIGIKYKPLYNQPNYNITKIQEDINHIKKHSLDILSSDKKTELEATLLETLKNKVLTKPSFSENYTSLYEKANSLLLKKINVTESLKELVNDALLQAWVRSGIELHSGKRTSCGFCGQILPHDLWIKLEKHFSLESQELEIELKSLTGEINSEIFSLDNIPIPDKNEFYLSEQSEYDSVLALLTVAKDKYKFEIKKLIDLVSERLKNIYFTVDIGSSNLDNSLNIAIDNFNKFIDEFNSRNAGFVHQQLRARNALRLNDINEFLLSINYDKDIDTLTLLEEELLKLSKKVEKLKGENTIVNKEIEILHSKIVNEKEGAEKINKYLNHYFGHGGLRLQAEKRSDFDKDYIFRIMRGDMDAYNLSDGERSLVAFCYFIAKLEDQNSKGKKLTIFIDDPISSLDSNHIFFVFSLIEGLLTAPIIHSDQTKEYKYEQLFISTHNLEFLKYLKRISSPKNECEKFIVVRGQDSSALRLMPSYLKNYITELNYLFGEIYACALDDTDDKHHSIYNFGNNLRKFLEAFLFYKYPNSIEPSRDHDERIKRFFGKTENAGIYVSRLTNEFSHLVEYLDRSSQPIDHQEINKLAKFILSGIKDNDLEQYQCFLQSIGKEDIIK